MTTTTQETAQETPAPVLGEIHVTAQGVLWTLGGIGTVRGLTAAGIAAAASASGEFLGSLDAEELRALDQRGGRNRVRISHGEWLIPLPHGRAEEIAAGMTGVINAPGAIGPVG